MRYFILYFIVLLILTGCSQTKPKPIIHSVDCNESVYALKSAQCLDDDAFLQRLAPYPVIFVGDHHLSAKQHRFVAQMIRGLSEQGYRVHLANEWFTPDDNALLAEYASRSFNDGNFTEKIEWEKRVNLKFDLFRPIYHAVQEGGGMLYGVNLSKEERKRISDVNLTGMDAAEKAFFETLDLNVSAHSQLLAPYFSHCHKPKLNESNEACLTRMYRVQVAWDAKMGQESARLAQRVLLTPQDKLVVFVGAMHLSKGLGANLRFARESNLPFVTVVPQSWEHDRIEHGEADFVYIYEMDKAAKEAEDALVKKLNEKADDKGAE